MKIALIGYKGNLGKLIDTKLNVDFSIDLDNSTNFFKLSKIDVVIHLGEKSDPNITLEESLSNIRSSINYIDHSIKIGVKHFIYASSHRINGSWENNFKLDKKIYYPVTYYGSAKLFIENILKLKFNKNITISILRIGSILGEDNISNKKLEILNSEKKGKYELTRVKKNIFVKKLKDQILCNNKKINILNVFPQKSKLNQIFDGKNFFNN